MSDNITDENFDKIHEAIDTTITTLEDSGSELGDIALCMFVEGANILEQMCSLSPYSRCGSGMI